MFSGLNKKIKDILPKQLFYRGLLIVALPIIILQFTISVVFFDSLWIKTNKGMTRALVAEVKTFIDAYDKEESNKKFLIELYKDNLGFEITYHENSIFKKDSVERWFSPVDRSLRRELKSKNLKRRINFESLKIDLNKLFIFNGKKEFKINNTEKIILEKMINSPGQIFSREEIGKIINLDKERSIDVIITRLRKKIESDSKNPKYLQTIRGEGYVLWIE